jgi:anti-sigma factor RsiW
MPDAEAPVARLSRVTTRRGTLRQLNCPLEPELLVAEFSGELPPDVAVAVREHMAVCEICGKRAQELRTPYALLASLGASPAPYVPDLRDAVRVKTKRVERVMRPLRALGAFGRFIMVSVALALVVILIVVFAGGGLARSFGLLTVGRTTNQIQNAPAAASHGLLFAETDKLVTVTDASGTDWQIAEVIAVNQRNAQVTHSLPASNGSLRQASANMLPVAIVAQGNTVYELTARQQGTQQALIAINATSGALRFVRSLTLPGGGGLPLDTSAVSLALAPDGSAAYVGLSRANANLPDQRVLVVATASGKVTKTINLTTPSTIPLPPPVGSLPSSAFPSVIPYVSVAGMAQTEAADGAIGVSPDGAALFDVTLAHQGHSVRYAIIRRVDLTTGQVTTLGLLGDFAVTKLAMSLNSSAPELYLVTGSPDAEVYVIDAVASSPALTGQIALGGPAAPTNVTLHDTLTVSAAPNTAQLYVTQDATSSDGLINAHNRWDVDTNGMGVLGSATDPATAGALLANSVPQGKTFALFNGQIAIGSPDLGSGWTTWFKTNDGTPIVALIETTN